LTQKVDVLIIGAGIIGLATAKALLESDSKLRVVILEKELSLGFHASGRNSGVLHAGFYYTPESLKAQFCKDGNSELRKLCQEFDIPVREVGKVVVTKSMDEEVQLEALFRRGTLNGVNLEFLPRKDLVHFEPLATTKENFVWSPETAVSDPQKVISALAHKVTELGCKIVFGQLASPSPDHNSVSTTSTRWLAKHIINTSGAQSDRIARIHGFSKNFLMIPFMGIYRYVESQKLPLKRLVYPVPNPLNPFLGVHFTLTSGGLVKIGPTAIPVLNREGYALMKNWNRTDIKESLTGILAMLKGNSHDVPAMIRSEFPKFHTSTLLKSAAKIVPSAAKVNGWKNLPPGIRAQLVDVKSGALVTDFLIEGDRISTHVLNAVSPGWTSALPFGRHIAERVLATF
jgi:L-2-hydroxyglutarate oxidase